MKIISNNIYWLVNNKMSLCPDYFKSFCTDFDKMIVDYLDFKDILNLAKVNKYYNELTHTYFPLETFFEYSKMNEYCYPENCAIVNKCIRLSILLIDKDDKCITKLIRMCAMNDNDYFLEYALTNNKYKSKINDCIDKYYNNFIKICCMCNANKTLRILIKNRENTIQLNDYLIYACISIRYNAKETHQYLVTIIKNHFGLIKFEDININTSNEPFYRYTNYSPNLTYNQSLLFNITSIESEGILRDDAIDNCCWTGYINNIAEYLLNPFTSWN